MTKYCGLSKIFITFVATLFCLTLTAPQSRADEISVGTGVLTLCWNGVSAPCDFPGDQPNVSFTDTAGKDQVTIHIAGNADGTNAQDLDSPLYVIFAVPFENLLNPFGIGPQFNTADGTSTGAGLAGTIDSVGLFEGYNPTTGSLTGCCPPPAAPPADDTLNATLPAAGSLAYLGTATMFGTQGDYYDASDYDPSTQQLNNKFFADFLDVDGVAGGSDSDFSD